MVVFRTPSFGILIRTTNVELRRKPRGFSKSRGLAPRNFRLAAKQQNVLERSAEEAGHPRFARLPRRKQHAACCGLGSAAIGWKTPLSTAPMLLCRTLAANLKNR